MNVVKIFKSDSTETLLITLEKGALFPTHTSPKSTFLVVLEGNIDFHINSQIFNLSEQQSYRFEKNLEHYVTANKNAKFLIIR